MKVGYKRCCSHCGKFFVKKTKYSKVCPSCNDKSRSLAKLKAKQTWGRTRNDRINIKKLLFSS